MTSITAYLDQTEEYNMKQDTPMVKSDRRRGFFLLSIHCCQLNTTTNSQNIEWLEHCKKEAYHGHRKNSGTD